MKVFFLDTNFFLQCRDLEQLPLKEVSQDADELLLLIPRPVQEEIDDMKQNGKGRRSERSRKTSSFFRKIIFSEGTKMTIRESGPKVEITFSPPMNPKRKPHDILDLSKSDDRIIEEALAFKAENRDADVAILTHDVNLLLTAKRCGLLFVVIPDSWLLQPSPDHRDKKIAELELRLQHLEKSYPQIDISLYDAGGKQFNSLSIQAIRYENLTEAELKELMIEMQTRYPVVTAFDKSEPTENPYRLLPFVTGLIEYSYMIPSESEIKEYQEIKYPDWLKKVKDFIISIPTKLEQMSHQVEISFMVTNSGSVPAENVIVEFEAKGGLFIGMPSKDAQKSVNFLSQFPAPPAAPKGRWVQRKAKILSLMENMVQPLTLPASKKFLFENFNKNLMPVPKDRYTFYWKPRRPDGNVPIWTFECEEFRHQGEPEDFFMRVIVPSETTIEKGALICQITAKNLPKPITYILPIKVEYPFINAVEKIRQILNQAM
ncbi:MAG: PIN domain-containing protein [Nitrospirota bacterium]|nr:PIN domain-containing protein [Nitrospirota bacterium]